MRWFFVCFFLCACMANKKKTNDALPTATPPAVVVPTNPAGVIATPVPSGNPLFDCLTTQPGDSEVSTKITAFDQLIAESDASTELSAKFERRLFNINLDNLPVKFFTQQFTLDAVSNKDGKAKVTLSGVASLPALTCYTIQAKNDQVTARLFRWANATPIIITDIDGVLSNLPEALVPLTLNKITPTVPDAVASLATLSQKYRIIYLTSRDETLFNKTSDWLHLNGFPPGPLFTWDWDFANRFGLSRSEQGKYKTTLIKNLQTRFNRIVAGVGNLPHDAQAYLDAGMRAFIINKSGSGMPAGSVVVKSWTEIATSPQL